MREATAMAYTHEGAAPPQLEKAHENNENPVWPEVNEKKVCLKKKKITCDLGRVIPILLLEDVRDTLRSGEECISEMQGTNI